MAMGEKAIDDIRDAESFGELDFEHATDRELREIKGLLQKPNTIGLSEKEAQGLLAKIEILESGEKARKRAERQAEEEMRYQSAYAEWTKNGTSAIADGLMNEYGSNFKHVMRVMNSTGGDVSRMSLSDLAHLRNAKDENVRKAAEAEYRKKKAEREAHQNWEYNDFRANADMETRFLIDEYGGMRRYNDEIKPRYDNNELTLEYASGKHLRQLYNRLKEEYKDPDAYRTLAAKEGITEEEARRAVADTMKRIYTIYNSRYGIEGDKQNPDDDDDDDDSGGSDGGADQSGVTGDTVDASGDNGIYNMGEQTASIEQPGQSVLDTWVNPNISSVDLNGTNAPPSAPEVKPTESQMIGFDPASLTEEDVEEADRENARQSHKVDQRRYVARGKEAPLATAMSEAVAAAYPNYSENERKLLVKVLGDNGLNIDSDPEVKLNAFYDAMITANDKTKAMLRKMIQTEEGMMADRTAEDERRRLDTQAEIEARARVNEEKEKTKEELKMVADYGDSNDDIRAMDRYLKGRGFRLQRPRKVEIGRGIEQEIGRVEADKANLDGVNHILATTDEKSNPRLYASLVNYRRRLVNDIYGRGGWQNDKDTRKFKAYQAFLDNPEYAHMGYDELNQRFANDRNMAEANIAYDDAISKMNETKFVEKAKEFLNKKGTKPVGLNTAANEVEKMLDNIKDPTLLTDVQRQRVEELRKLIKKVNLKISRTNAYNHEDISVDDDILNGQPKIDDETPNTDEVQPKTENKGTISTGLMNDLMSF